MSDHVFVAVLDLSMTVTAHFDVTTAIADLGDGAD